VKKEHVQERIKAVGIVAAIRLRSKEDALFAAEAVRQGGVPIVEIAMTLDGATDVISHLRTHDAELIVGAGSVLDEEMAQACLDAGAQFITSDRLHRPIVECAAQHEVVSFPGALTPSEVVAAWESGCDFVKVVPCAQIGGEAYIRSLHAMFPRIPLIAAGGIDQQTASKFILAGAIALGIGRELIPREAIRRRQEGRIHELARRFVAFVKTAREGKLPEREGENMQYSAE
jgi:2-dehydro-3-deoxyphosphogluconate aldolase/(4S)-4-hydroxy-2-oxoglutarate aldolase